MNHTSFGVLEKFMDMRNMRDAPCFINWTPEAIDSTNDWHITFFKDHGYG